MTSVVNVTTLIVTFALGVIIGLAVISAAVIPDQNDRYTYDRQPSRIDLMARCHNQGDQTWN